MSATPQPQQDSPDAPTPVVHPVIIALSLVCCFPLGLLFVWGHPEWTRATKFLWTGVWAGIMLIGFVGMEMEERATREAIAEAEQLWERGEKADAVDKYRHLLDAKFSSIPEEDCPFVLRRVIEFDVEQGNHEQARRFIALAERKKVALSLESPEARALLAEFSAASRSDTPATVPVQSQPHVDVAVSATTLATERADNELRFDSQYKGTRIQVTGVVKKVEKASFGQQYIGLAGTGRYDVVCYCKRSERPKLLELSAGDRVTVYGEYSRTMLTSIWLTNCEIAADETDARARAGSAKVRTSSQPKLAALQEIVAKLAQSPDRFAGDSERRAFNAEVERLIERFEAVPFDAAQSPNEARAIVELYEQKIEHRYSGHLINLLEEEIIAILTQLQDR